MFVLLVVTPAYRIGYRIQAQPYGVTRPAPACPEEARQPAQGMDAAEVCYAPTGWPSGTRAIMLRVPIAAEHLSSDPRARRRRTVDPCQLPLRFNGQLDTA